MKKSLSLFAFTALISLSSSAFAMVNCSDGSKTTDCSCPSGFRAECSYLGGAFCQNNSPTGADKDCAPKSANVNGGIIKSIFSTPTVTIIKGKVQTAAPVKQ